MKTIDLAIDELREAPWNANQMNEVMYNRLKESLRSYGLVQPLVVRPLPKSQYEVLSGNQRLRAIRELGFRQIPCVIIELDNHNAMLLAQTLNAIHGSDDLARKGNVLKNILSVIPRNRVLSLLPETVESLKALSTIGQEDLAAHLQAWQAAQSVRLHHLQLQLTGKQLELVERAIGLVTAKVKDSANDNPNRRGNAIFRLCQFYLDNVKEEKY